jgi:uncharacterized membrane protein YoaK (UPF0700 family)
MTSYIFREPYYSMFMAGSKDVNDLGDFYTCEAMPEAMYAVFSLNVTSIPIVVRLGFCLPAECTMDSLNRGTNYAGDLVTNFLHTLNIELVNKHDTHVSTYFKSLLSFDNFADSHELGSTIIGGLTIWIIIFVIVVSLYFYIGDRKLGKHT